MTEQIPMIREEEYEFAFTRQELELVHRANVKPARNGLIVMGIFFAAVLALLWTDLLEGISGGVLLGIFLLGVLMNLISISNMRKKFVEDVDPVLQCRYHYRVFRDHADLIVRRDQLQIAAFRVEYGKLKAVLDADSHYIYAYNNGAYLIPKAALQPDSPFGTALQQKVAPKKGAEKKYRILTEAVFWAALVGTMVAVLLPDWIPGLDDSFSRAKLILVFLPLPILSVILGVVLRKKGIRWKRNVIFGSIIAAILAFSAGINFLSGLIDRLDFSRPGDTAYLEQVEDTLSIDFPELESISDYEHSSGGYSPMNGQERHICYGWVSEADMPQFAQQIESDNRWLTRLPTVLRGLLPPGIYLYAGERVLLYNMDTGEYNAVPGQPGTYRFLCVQYDPESGSLDIYEYEIEYIV